jgi:hypothetical protein
VQRVRYCLTGTTLIRQEQTWGTVAPPALVASLCPEPNGWANNETIAQNVVNGSTPLFTYNNAPCGNGVTPPLAQIKSVGLCMKVEAPVKAGERRRPAELATIVALRNEVDGQ